MLDLEVIPERALGGRQWEFILGELSTHLLASVALFELTPYPPPPPSRYAVGSGRGDTEETVCRYQERTLKVQRAGTYESSLAISICCVFSCVST